MSNLPNPPLQDLRLPLAVATLGTPRIGPRRELKMALEAFWSGKSDEKSPDRNRKGLRAANWRGRNRSGSP